MYRALQEKTEDAAPSPWPPWDLLQVDFEGARAKRILDRCNQFGLSFVLLSTCVARHIVSG